VKDMLAREVTQLSRMAPFRPALRVVIAFGGI
jgi:hypothetical protein